MATNTKKTRLALIGMGNQGQEHLIGQAASQDCCFVAGVEAVVERHAAIKQAFPGLSLFASLDELLKQQNELALDGLVLCLPHHAYEELWEQLVATKLPILKEKPLGRNLEEARQLSSKVQGGRLQTAIQRRHHTSYLQLKQLLQEQQVSIYEAHTWLHLGRKLQQERTAGDWRADQKTAGGGILLDAGYHLVDLLHFFVGSLELVNCELWQAEYRLPVGQLDDRAQLLLRNASTWAFLDARLDGELDDKNQPLKSEGIRLLTDQGEYFADRTRICKDGQLLWEGEREWQQAMGRQLDDFAQAITTDDWYASTYWEQLPAMQLIEQAYQQAARI